MLNIATCYMCDSISTSEEQVPPSCFFPKIKDIDRDLRSNLITVPSGDLHNFCRSKDDEYLRTVILMSAGNNAAGQHQFFDKLLTSIARRPHTYSTLLFQTRELWPVGNVELYRLAKDASIDASPI